MMSPQARKRRSELAIATAAGDPEKIAAARRAFRVQRAEDTFRELIAMAAPLTTAQIGRLAEILDSAPRADGC